jgi:hypothetical protein
VLEFPALADVARAQGRPRAAAHVAELAAVLRRAAGPLNRLPVTPLIYLGRLDVSNSHDANIIPGRAGRPIS